MRGFLLAVRIQLDVWEKARFPLAKSLFREMKSDVLKAVILKS
jgi:hypothetical protein